VIKVMSEVHAVLVLLYFVNILPTELVLEPFGSFFTVLPYSFVYAFIYCIYSI
jgi:hypothetical protein